MANIDWSKLTFSYTKTNTILKTEFKDGAWTPIASLTEDYLHFSAYAGALHYAIECFEGLKAFRGKDGRIRLFRPEENAKRLIRSAKYLGIEAPSVEMFVEMCKRVVLENIDFLPPYEEAGASLYLRPTLIGTNPQLGVQSSKESTFMVLCAPVGAYVGGALDAVDVVIARNYDRAAPNGSGSYKVGGNYAASLMAGERAKSEGYSAVLYLDPKEKKYIDECGPANFFAIKDGVYITPKSGSILPSVTNMSLQQIAKDLGIEVECRPIPLEELAECQEAAECGTAAVATPISRIDDIEEGKSYTFGSDDEAGPITTKLYNRLRAIQLGDEPDTHNWVTIVE